MSFDYDDTEELSKKWAPAKRAQRRAAVANAKAKVIRKQKNSDRTSWAVGRLSQFDVLKDPAWIGKQASVHSCACSCAMCTSTDGEMPISAERRVRVGEDE